MAMDIDSTEIEAAFEDISKDVAEELANRWFSESQDILYQEGDSLQYKVFPVAQSGMPPQWDSNAGGYRFGYSHKASLWFEYGTTPHEIPVGDKGFLAWKDDETGEWIYTSESVQHPGTPALKFIRRGKQAAMQFTDFGDGE